VLIIQGRGAGCKGYVNGNENRGRRDVTDRPGAAFCANRTIAAKPSRPGVRGYAIQSSKDEGDPYVRLFQRRQITAQRAEISLLIETLSELLGRPVIDKTGLAGKYAFKRAWRPDATQVRSSATPVDDDEYIPSLTGVIQEQLGLRLLPQKGPTVRLLTLSHDRRQQPQPEYRLKICGMFWEKAERASTMSHPASWACCFKPACTCER